MKREKSETSIGSDEAGDVGVGLRLNDTEVGDIYIEKDSKV